MAFISNLGNTGNTANNFVNNNNNNMQTVATTVAPTRSSPLHLQDGQCVSPRTIQHLHPIIAQMQNPATAQLVYQQLLNSAIAAQSQLLQNAHSSLLHTVSQQQQHHQQQQQRQSHHSDILANVGVAQVLMTAHGLNQLMLQPNLLQQQLQTLAHLLNPLVYYQQLASLIQQQQQHQQQQPQPQQQQSSNTIAPLQNGIGASAAAAAAAIQQQKFIENFLSEQTAANNSIVEKIQLQQVCSQAVSSAKNIAEMDSEQIGEHISDLIMKHTAILEENPSQIKRRAYHRQAGRPSSMEIQLETQSQDNSSVRTILGGSLATGQPVLRFLDKVFTCNYCQVTFVNEAALEAHEIRCIKRGNASQSQLTQFCRNSLLTLSNDTNDSKQPSTSSSLIVLENRHPLKRRLLAAAENDEPKPSTSKLAKLASEEHVKDIKPAMSDAITNPLSNSFFSQFNNCIQLNSNQIPPVESKVSSSQKERAVDVSRPYILTLNDTINIRREAILQPRCRLRSLTTETYACSKAHMMYFEAKGNFSFYTNYQQAKINDEEAKKNILYMSSYSSKPRAGIKRKWRFTTAMREMGVLKATHSSFWDYSTKIRMHQNNAVNGFVITNNLISSQNNNISVDKVKREALSIVSTITTTSVTTTITSAGIAFGASVDSKSIEGDPSIPTLNASEDPSKKNTKLNLKESSPKISMIQRIVGGYRTDEVYVYVRGRGRGRYICDRCGIRCKKPSMLKKHIKSHTDIRPYNCKHCNFSFKTKGNLTKHLQSKAHKRRTCEKQSLGDEQDYDSDQDRLEIASQPGSSNRDPLFDDDCTSEEEMKVSSEKFMNISAQYHNFGQENILFERNIHTPPSFWMVGETTVYWPDSERQRLCHSAPPAASLSPSLRKREKNEKESPTSGSGDELKLIINTYEDEIEQSDVIPSDTPVSSEFAPEVAQPIVSQSLMGSFMVKEEMVCDICDRVFRKATELALHRHTHSLEQQNAKTRSYHCTECKHSFRSKSLLNRHIEVVHSNAKRHRENNDSETASSDPRAFRCTDCDIGFRKHGILSKHLRSKGHVAKLESQGKLPEDALALISNESNISCLNRIDTTDCERTRLSLIAILASLRDSASLECREQLMQSPAPPSNRIAFTPRRRSVASFSVSSSNKRSSTKKCDNSNTSLNQNEAMNKKSDSVLLLKTNEDLAGKSISANIWIPPKSDLSLLNDRRLLDNSLSTRNLTDSSAFSDNGSSVRSDEANSDGACRSESSTPTQKLLGSVAASPLLPISTRCTVCNANFETAFDLQVHLHADHIELRDGNDFRCPTRGCDKVYPNRENLRLHIAAHFYGGGATPVREGCEENEGATTILSEMIGSSGFHRKLAGNNSSDQHANSAPNHSPGIPEESRTPTCPRIYSSTSKYTTESNGVSQTVSFIRTKLEESRNDQIVNNCVSSDNDTVDQEESNSKDRQTPITATALPCAICGSCFPDAFILQKHWLSHVCDRPHICKLCDAGFTTVEALNAHTLTHQNIKRS